MSPVSPVLFELTFSNNIFENNITNNWGGIELALSSNNVLRRNSMADNQYNFWVKGNMLSDFVNDIDTSNTIDGKPVYYWINERNRAVPLDAGYVALVNCTRITVKNLNLTNNGQGLLLAFTTNSTITKNDIANNECGIWLESSSNNAIYHNNFVGNERQIVTWYSVNVWDDGYPSGGNYWSNYMGADLFSGPYQNETGSDGIGDTPHIIDNYPLMGMFHDFPISSIDFIGKLEKTFHVTTISNSTIRSFGIYPIIIPEEAGGVIVLDVFGPEGTRGFCRFTIPKDLLDCPEGLEYWAVYLNETDVTSSCNIWENSTHTFIYVPYNHSIQEIVVKGTWIVPEFPTWTSIIPVFVALTVIIAIYKRRLLKTPVH